MEYSGGVAGLPQAFAQGASVKKPLLIFNASAVQKLGYTQIFVAAEIHACLLGHSFGKFLERWFFEVARMLGVSKAIPGEADYRAESRLGGQASMINMTCHFALAIVLFVLLLPPPQICSQAIMRKTQQLYI